MSGYSEYEKDCLLLSDAVPYPSLTEWFSSSTTMFSTGQELVCSLLVQSLLGIQEVAKWHFPSDYYCAIILTHLPNLSYLRPVQEKMNQTWGQPTGG